MAGFSYFVGAMVGGIGITDNINQASSAAGKDNMAALSDAAQAIAGFSSVFNPVAGMVTSQAAALATIAKIMNDYNKLGLDNKKAGIVNVDPADIIALIGDVTIIIGSLAEMVPGLQLFMHLKINLLLKK